MDAFDYMDTSSWIQTETFTDYNSISQYNCHECRQTEIDR